MDWEKRLSTGKVLLPMVLLESASSLQPKFPLVWLNASLALIFPLCLFSWLRSSFPAPPDSNFLPL